MSDTVLMVSTWMHLSLSHGMDMQDWCLSIHSGWNMSPCLMYRSTAKQLTHRVYLPANELYLRLQSAALVEPVLEVVTPVPQRMQLLMPAGEFLGR